MKSYLAGLACFVFAALACVSSGAQKTEAKIEGNWVIVGISLGGKKLPEQTVAKLKAFIVFKDGKLLRYREDLTKPSDEEDTSYKIDFSKKPATIDLIEKDGKVKPGIFALNGDNLRIASGDPRPKTFEDAKGVDVLTLKRLK